MTSLLKTTLVQEPSSSTVNLTFGTSGQVTVGQNLTVSNTLTPLGSIAAAIKLPAGTTQTPPINLSYTYATSTAGSIGYGSEIFLVTPKASQNATINLFQDYTINSFTQPTFSGSTSPFSWLGVGVTLNANTIYAFEGLFAFTKTIIPAGTWILSTSFGGTATLNYINYNVYRYYSTTGLATANVAPSSAFFQTAAASTTMTANSASTVYEAIFIKGTVSINAGGTFLPQASVTDTGIRITTTQDSYFIINPLGPSGSNVSIGPWA